MAILDTFYIDELISARRHLHGGERGAPRKLEGGHREGSSINRAGIVLLTSQLQSYVEDVFFDCAAEHLPGLAEPRGNRTFRKSFSRWGNPSADNIKALFQRLGCDDVLGDLCWQNCRPETVRKNLNGLNELRNGIAHGKAVLTVGKKAVSMSLGLVESYRNFAVAFAGRFEDHAKRSVR